MTEPKNEEVAGRNGSENVEGDGDLGEGLLRDDSGSSVVEDGFELHRSCHGMEVIGGGLVAEEAAVTGTDEGE